MKECSEREREVKGGRRERERELDETGACYPSGRHKI